MRNETQYRLGGAGRGPRLILQPSRRRVAIAALAAAVVLTACVLDRDRERAIKKAVEHVKETMSAAAPEMAHPEPYFSGASGQCSLPGWSSSKEKLRYQAEVPLSAGDDGLARQARALRYWLDKGGELYQTSTGDIPPQQVDHEGGSISVYVSLASDRLEGPHAARILNIVATTRCVPKEE